MSTPGLDGKVALVTGAAGGLGAAVAARLAEEHAVLLTDVNAERLADVAGELAANGARVAHATCDVSERASVQAAFTAAEEQLGEVTALANVAGIGKFHPFTELTEEMWDRTYAVNACRVGSSTTMGGSWTNLVRNQVRSAGWQRSGQRTATKSRAKPTYCCATTSGDDGPHGDHHCGRAVHRLTTARAASRGKGVPMTPRRQPSRTSSSTMRCCSARAATMRVRAGSSRLRISLAPMKASSRRWVW